MSIADDVTIESTTGTRPSCDVCIRTMVKCGARNGIARYRCQTCGRYSLGNTFRRVGRPQVRGVKPCPVAVWQGGTATCPSCGGAVAKPSGMTKCRSCATWLRVDGNPG